MNNRPPESPQNKDPKKAPPTSGGSPLGNAQRFWIIGIGVVILLFVFLMLNNNSGFSAANALNYTELAQLIRGGNVSEIYINGHGTEAIVRLNNSNALQRVYKDPMINLREEMFALGVTESEWQRVNYASMPRDDTSSIIFNLALVMIPTVIIVWFLWRMMRASRVGQDQAMNFGRSRARVTRDMERPQVTFADVAGADESKEELKEVVEFLKEPEKFIRLGARVPKGVLMIGPPGTGKTLMARAVAGEAGVPFFSISGSEFVEMFVGVGASRVRDLFDRAKAEAPAIIFVDEIDAVGRHRGAGLGGGHDEREQTLNQILVEMDGFETGTNLIIIAATNRPDILDPALLRPGRFDRKVIMDNPDIKGRIDILKVHAKGKPLAPTVDLDAIARITAGFSGADLENLINEAAILAARRNLKAIGMSELQESMERVVMGPERKTRVISDNEKVKIAIHEAGHALMHYTLEHAQPVHKITIIPRGRAGGYVMSLPEGEDTTLYSREQFEAQIACAMGGRAAEEVRFNQFTTGASSDIQQATRLARMMVTQFGMSEKLGPRTYGSGSGSVFLGRDLGESRDYSEHYAEEIDNEVKRILQNQYQVAKNVITQNYEKLEKLSTVLIEQETLDREAFEELMGGPKKARPSLGQQRKTLAPESADAGS
ncbi:MAG TPA: ATP-dependent zinc metalloprotease FtsH, partial [Aggregatilineales bacterium]|nr:ATP-dependent zinc metalloprotease FtsH [Aggregatilineales bacterium]